MASELNVQISVAVLEPQELTAQEQQAMQLAQEAANDAYAPYSNFLVGAALVLEDGTIFEGSNQENAAYPSGLCAERTALFALSAHHPKAKIKLLAVTARRRHEQHHLPAMPCGACRQVMSEYEFKQKEPIPVLLQAADGKFYRFRNVSDLLPFQFTPEHL
ncbi:cytidine deaminase [Pontibacter akesuensis]|uniref:Cytidine deaminase n=1 Tax=Pontibacter akesuensis TaxID=388950 RepID=A0A1I7J490_9BACT|nr:cytidine deaminase [Pontibacter akesuensis]GHA72522.1 cytidine deaminase [Pontibacter akesuensis]SFU79951.1 cytidine deaminase [Pontibacter akesuensis]